MNLEDSSDRGGGRETSNQKIKIALLGNEGVGKTSLITQLVENRYNTKTNTTVGAMFVNKTMTIDKTDLDM